MATLVNHTCKSFIKLTLGLVFFVLKSRLRIARKWNREKFSIFFLKLQSHFRILIHRTWDIGNNGYAKI